MIDFYYSKKMKSKIQFLDGLRDKEVPNHKVFVDGGYKPFTFQVAHGERHSAKWDDIVFVGTATEEDIIYDFVKFTFADYLRQKEQMK